ncbi:MAG: hypothetical protein M3R36_18705 [Bacteroidota bacterium]|nr:hypothetical protein [Bacteroidota bacterium]
MAALIESFATGISILSMIVISYGSILAILNFVRNELGRIYGRISFRRLSLT